MENSILFFSDNTSRETREEVVIVLGIAEVQNPSKYLGLKKNLGSSKRKDLAFLRDKIRKILHGWRQIHLNSVGKKVLIKLVITVIHKYTTSLFLLPKTLCEDINGASTRFWWSKIDGENGIH